ncbi:hypothetical protein G6F43_014116 [Rhizopus delemar]|nr:hypothetical protein G6F43_014116 [Rhizopus delemar]
MNQLALNKGQIEAHITATPYDPETGEDLTQLGSILNLLDTDDLFDVIYNCVNQNPEPVDELYIHERMMLETFEQYRTLTQEQEKAKDLKEQVTLRFLEHVDEWSRLSFGGTLRRRRTRVEAPVRLLKHLLC